jgi:hypothetical protein
LYNAAEHEIFTLLVEDPPIEEFPDILQPVFSLDLPGVISESLRHSFVSATAISAKSLYACKKDFKTSIDKIPRFTSELAHALSGADPIYDNNFRAEYEMKCESCRQVWNASSRERFTSSARKI